MKLVSRSEADWSQPVLQVSRGGLVVKCERRAFRWHPGLLHTRLEAGWSHPLVRAMALVKGDRVLDCTLGLGTDAAFLAHLTGCRVIGLEAIPGLALLTSEGLQAAGHNVHAICSDSRHMLPALPSGSFDVVQGDPMFPSGTGVNFSLEVVRLLGMVEPLGQTWLKEARRVARKRVVVRDLADGSLLERMKPDDVLAVGRGRPRYGIWYAA